MIRKLAFLVLLVVLIFGVYFFMNSGKAETFFPISVTGIHPSLKPFPTPWSNPSSPQVHLIIKKAGLQLAGQSLCPAEYVVQQGDTAGSIARQCGVSLSDLQSTNPNLNDLNKIYPGQKIIISQSTAVNSAEVEVKDQEIVPALSVMRVKVDGLPASARVRIGLGLSESGYQVLLESQADQNGKLDTQMILPESAVQGDTAFILVSCEGSPALQVISVSFIIGP